MKLIPELYKLAIEAASNHIVITDEEGVIVYANKAASEMTGYSNVEIIGKNPRLWGGQMEKEFYKNMWETIKVKKKVFKGEIINKRKNGEIYTALITISPILDKDGHIQGFIGIEEDMSDVKKAIADLQKQSKEFKSLSDLMIGREMKMIELKKRLKDLGQVV